MTPRLTDWLPSGRELGRPGRRPVSAPAKVTVDILPECRFEVHFACKSGEVRTPTHGDLVFPARHCACPCHRPEPKESPRV